MNRWLTLMGTTSMIALFGAACSDDDGGGANLGGAGGLGGSGGESAGAGGQGAGGTGTGGMGGGPAGMAGMPAAGMGGAPAAGSGGMSGGGETTTGDETGTLTTGDGGLQDDTLEILFGYDDADGDNGFPAGANNIGGDAGVPDPVVEGGEIVFTLPFTTENEQFGWNHNVDPARDLSNGEVVVRVYWESGFVPEGAWGGFQIFAWGPSWDESISVWNSFTPEHRGQWVEFTLDMDTSSDDFDPTQVMALGYTFATGNYDEENDEGSPPAEPATTAVFRVDWIGFRAKSATGGGDDGGTQVVSDDAGDTASEPGDAGVDASE